MADETIDAAAGVRVDDIPEDGVLAARVGDDDVMLARGTDSAGRPWVSALDAACTHLGAKLPTGIRTGDRVHCPFHHACFDLRSGEATVAPAIEPLRRWRVEVEGGVARVAAAAPVDQPGADGPAPGTPGRVDDDRGVQRVVVIGGGGAGFAAVEKLRRAGFAGAVALVSEEREVPIDRTFVSKNYLSGAAPAEKLPLKPRDWYEEQRIDLHLGTPATGIDLAERIVTLADGDELGYDALLLATGSAPKRPDLPGFDREDVIAVRDKWDADAILQRVTEGARVAVVGSGFIGLEVAASLTDRGAAVTVLTTSPVPLGEQLGEALGGLVRSLHESKGVRFVEGAAAGWDGSALQVQDGEPIEADLVVLGLGVTPRTELAEAAGLQVDDGVVVDAYGETAVHGVFAAGDIARFPDPLTGRLIRVEHWAQAQRAGALAAVNLLGGQQPLLEPPFFWSKHWDLSIRFCGHPGSTEEATVDGDVAGRDATVQYREAGRVTGVAGVGRDREVLELEEALLREPAR